MEPGRVLSAAAVAFAAAGGFGSLVALHDDVAGEPFGVTIPVSVRSGLLLGWGAGVAAPWPMPVAALYAAARANRAGGKLPASVQPGVVAAALGVGCIAGTLVEPVTYHPRAWTPAIRTAIAANLVASAGLAAAGLRQAASRRRAMEEASSSDDATAAAPWSATMRTLREAAVEALGDRLVALYLHGSACLGGWVPDASDLDVLIVADPGTPRPALDALVAATLAASEPADASQAGLEVSVISSDAAARPSEPWPFLVHIVTSAVPGVDPRVVFDAGGGDPDLLMHIAVTRVAGIAFHGPPPGVLFGAVSRQDTLRYLVGELQWAVRHAQEKYAVLNACRALAYLDNDDIVSKTVGGEWALPRLPQHADLITRALQDQREGRLSGPITPQAHALVVEVVQRLQSQSFPALDQIPRDDRLD